MDFLVLGEWECMITTEGMVTTTTGDMEDGDTDLLIESDLAGAGVDMVTLLTGAGVAILIMEGITTNLITIIGMGMETDMVTVDMATTTEEEIMP